jgi:hypothetical protein
MSRKMIQKFVIGQWNNGVFTKGDVQPEEDITDLVTAVAWGRKAYMNKAGKYSFIREIPGNLDVVIQTSFLSKFGMAEDDDTVAPTVQG